MLPKSGRRNSHETLQQCIREGDDFVDWKRAQDFEYEVGERRLGHFDKFLANQEIESLVLTKQHLQDYKAALTPLGKTVRREQFMVVKNFARYYHQIEPKSALVGAIPFKRPETPCPFHLFSLITSWPWCKRPGS